MKYDAYVDEYSEIVKYPDAALPVKTWIACSRDFPSLSDVNHWHADFELLHILEGAMKYNINGEVVSLNKGDLLFVNSGNMHFGFQERYEECSILCLNFNPALLATSALEQSLDKICGAGTPPYLLFHEGRFDDMSFVECVKSIDKAFHSDKDSRVLEMLGEIYRLCAKLVERIAHTEQRQMSSEKQLQAMYRMTGFIQGNYANKVSIEEIAGAGLVCRSKCCRLFREFLGKTPVEYLTEYRIYKSLELLKSTDKSITDIAVSCGFCGSSYYAETFKRLMGCTPGEYRRR